MNRQTMLFGLLAAFVSAVAYGANVPFARISAGLGVFGPDIVVYRSIAMIALLAGIAAIQRDSLAIPGPMRLPILGLGLFTATVGLAYLSSVAFIPVGVATIIFYMFPLVIVIVSPFVDGEPLTLSRILVFLVAFCGLFLAIGPSFTSLDPRGLGLAALAVIGATGQFFFASKTTRVLKPTIVGFWSQLIILPIAIATVYSAGGPASLTTLQGAALPVMITAGLFLIAFILHLFASRAAPPAVIGLVYCAEPVTSILLASVVLDEALTLVQLAGGLLVFAAVIAAILVEQRRAA
jgi:drug/metabolite transporter (DMT)-like permease